jgi:hypothetical protein
LFATRSWSSHQQQSAVGFKKYKVAQVVAGSKRLNQGTHLLQLRGQLKNELDHFQGRVAEGDQN